MITLKKSIKLFFCGKTPKQWFCSREKCSQTLEETFFKKRNSCSLWLICADMIFKTMCGKFF